MKIDMIKELLEKSGAFAWRITDTVTKGWEFYFIRHSLDQNRSKDIENIQITVYVLSDDKKFVGTASADMGPDETGEYVDDSDADFYASRSDDDFGDDDSYMDENY